MAFKMWNGNVGNTGRLGCSKAPVSSPLSARAHRRFCELLPPEHRSVEESLQIRVSSEQILSLPELKVQSSVHSTLYPLYPPCLWYSP